MSFMNRGMSVATLLVGVALWACSGTGPGDDPGQYEELEARSVVGPDGGEFSTPDGTVTVRIPPGALDRDVEFSIEPIADPVPGHIGAAFEIGPTGTTFLAPVTIAMRYRDTDLEGLAPEVLAVSTIVDGRWQDVSVPALDLASRTIAGVTYHLSPYALAQVVTPNKPLPRGYEPCAWKVQHGDFCFEAADRCGYYDDQGDLVLAYCEGDPQQLNWATATSRASCPIKRPGDKAPCGTFQGECQYFTADPTAATDDPADGPVLVPLPFNAACRTFCSCTDQGWECIDNCSCYPTNDGCTGGVPRTLSCSPQNSQDCERKCTGEDGERKEVYTCLPNGTWGSQTF